MANVTTMQELSEREVPDHQRAEFQALVAAIAKNYPSDWQSWKVRDIPYNELFVEPISSTIEAKLRFAIPTDDIKEIFFGPDGHLSERGYKDARRKLLSWPLGRAIIYSPHALVTKIHPSPQAYERFMNTVATLKPKIRSIRGSSADRQEKASPVQTESTRSKRRLPSESSEAPTPKSPKNTELGVLTNMMDLLTKQTHALDNLTKRVNSIDQLCHKKNCEDESEELDELNDSFESVADSTTPVDTWQPASMSSPEPPASEDREKALRKIIVNAQRELAQFSTTTTQTMNPTAEDEDSWDFHPKTSETEPKVARADPNIVEQAIACQRFGDDSWKNVRYADVQKNFQATPAFCALKVNSYLAVNTPNWQSLANLEKIDLTLGAITYGLLQQRQALKEVYKNLSDSNRKEVKTKLFDDSKFRKITDQLLQYTCGRRAEAIQARRETYKSTNKVLNDMLHDIPPSTTHLFSEEKLNEVMKEQGGAQKFFLKKTTKKSRSSAPMSNAKTNKPSTSWKSKKPSGHQHSRRNERSGGNKQAEYSKKPQGGKKS